MNVETLVLIPLSAGLSGAVLSKAAVWALFRPLSPMTVAGFRIQGILPRQQPDLARFLAEAIETRLLSHDDVRAFVERPETIESIETVLGEQIDIFLQQKLGGNPMFALLIRGEAGQRIRELLIGQFRKAVPTLVESLMHQLQSGVDVQAVVRAKLESIDVREVETLLRSRRATELRMLTGLGAIAGFLAGLIQLLVLFLAGA